MRGRLVLSTINATQSVYKWTISNDPIKGLNAHTKKDCNMRRQKRICLSKDRVRLRILGMQCLILPKDEDKPPTYAVVPVRCRGSL